MRIINSFTFCCILVDAAFAEERKPKLDFAAPAAIAKSDKAFPQVDRLSGLKPLGWRSLPSEL